MVLRLVRIAGGVIAAMQVLLALGWGALQTGPGRSWLAARVGALLSDPSEHVTVSGIDGLVPFDFGVRRVVVADAAGPRVRVDDIRLAIAARDLLSGRLTVRNLSIADAEIVRPGENRTPTDWSAVLHPPLAVSVARFEIGTLTLGPDLVGSAVTLTTHGRAAIGGGRAAAELAVQRTDGAPGSATLHFAYGGTPPQLEADIAVSEPTGTVLAAFLHRNENLPLMVTLRGAGPLDDWHGSLQAQAGTEAAAAATFTITGSAPYRVAVTGSVAAAPLLPPPLKALLGDRVTVKAEAEVAPDRIALERLDLAAAALSVKAQGHYAIANDAVSGTAAISLSDLAALAPSLAGTAEAQMTLAGTLARPEATTDVQVSKLRAGGIRAHAIAGTLRLSAAGDPLAVPVHVEGEGQVLGLATASAALPAGLGKTIGWRIDAQADAKSRAIAIDHLEITDEDASLTAQAKATTDRVEGTLRLALPEIARFDANALSGTLDTTVSFHAAPDGTGTAVVSGGIAAPHGSDRRIDAVLGPRVAFAGTVKRQADGAITVGDVAATGAALKLAGSAQRASDGALKTDFRVTLPRLAAIDPRLGGAATATGHLAGPPDALAGTLVIDAPAITAAGRRIEGVSARIALSGLAPPAGKIDAHLRINGVKATVTAEGTIASGGVRVSRFNAEAAGARIDGNFAFANGRFDANASGRIPDLRPFGSLAGTALGGSATLEARLAANRITATIKGNELAVGSGNPARVRQVTLTADIKDPFGRPSGRADATLADAAMGRASIRTLKLAAKSDRPGHFTLDLATRGTIGAPVTLAGHASLSRAPGNLALDVTRLSGTVGKTPFSLQAPLSGAWRDGSARFAGLKLGFGSGAISGDGALARGAVSLHLIAKTLPVQALARLHGQDAAGTLGFDLTISGTARAPHVHLVIDGEELRLAGPGGSELPKVGIVASADWRDGRIDTKGRLAGPQGAALGWTASAPLVYVPSPLSVAVPESGAVTAHVKGDGELGAFATLLPNAEDRISGRFTVDVSVAGTFGAPAATGHIAVTGGRYESFSTGAILDHVRFTLEGRRDQLVLTDFHADGATGGSLVMSGSVDFATALEPTVALSAKFEHLRALNRDEARATASGTLRLTGPVAAPHVTATVTIDEADLAVPERLPQSSQPVAATIIDSATGATIKVAAVPQPTPLMALDLDATIILPGRTFVRGRGLDSEWRGRIHVAGSPAAPILTGNIEVVQGTFDFLGKTFVLSKGTVTFLGERQIDPAVNIEARAQSTDITAIVTIAGTALKPTIGLTSQPALPRDEILSRLLFGTSMSQIGPAQGLQLASAAASLAGGPSLDVLGKIRRGLGLDRLALGSSSASGGAIGVPSLTSQPGQPQATGLGTTALAPAGSTGGVAGTTLNAGKYLANGVYVGVSQGLQTNSGTVSVNVDLSRHISVTTETGQASGTGVGINWKLDY